MNVGFCWLANTCVSICKSSLENVALMNEFVRISPTDPNMSYSLPFHSLHTPSFILYLSIHLLPYSTSLYHTHTHTHTLSLSLSLSHTHSIVTLPFHSILFFSTFFISLSIIFYFTQLLLSLSLSLSFHFLYLCIVSPNYFFSYHLNSIHQNNYFWFRFSFP